MRTFLLPRSADAQGRLVLRGEEYHYLTRVLRLREGDRFPGTDGAGGRFLCTIRSISGDRLELQVEADPGASPDAAAEMAEAEAPGAAAAAAPGGADGRPASPAPPRLYLYQALLKGKKMETVIRQATEAGVAAVIPVTTARTVPDYEADREEKKRRRWEKIAAEAVQQSGRTALPELSAPISIDRLAEHWADRGPTLFFHQDPLENSPLHQYLSVWPEAVALCIGPEGGFAPPEVEQLKARGCAPVHFTSPVLRAETAAVFALGAVHTILMERESWNPIPE